MYCEHFQTTSVRSFELSGWFLLNSLHLSSPFDCWFTFTVCSPFQALIAGQSVARNSCTWNRWCLNYDRKWHCWGVSLTLLCSLQQRRQNFVFTSMISGCFWSSSWPHVVYCISWILVASSRNHFNISNMVYSFLLKMAELKFQFHSPLYSLFVGCDCHGRGFAYLSIECVHVLQCSAYQAILSSYWCDVWELILWIRFSLHQLTIWVTFCGGSVLERHRRWLLTPTWKWHWQVLWALLTKQLHKNEVYCDVQIDVSLDTKAVWEAVTIVMDKHKVFQSLLFLNFILCVIICSLSILEASQLLSLLLNALEGPHVMWDHLTELLFFPSLNYSLTDNRNCRNGHAMNPVNK